MENLTRKEKIKKYKQMNDHGICMYYRDDSKEGNIPIMWYQIGNVIKMVDLDKEQSFYSEFGMKFEDFNQEMFEYYFSDKKITLDCNEL